MFKKQEGITLVALVITIIVLLILAGVSISLVIGNNGVLTQATEAVEANKIADAREALNMALAATETIYYGQWTANTSTARGTVYNTEGTLAAQLTNLGYTLDATSVMDATTKLPNGKMVLTNGAGETFTFSSVVVDANTGKATIGAVEFKAAEE